jgi:tRNA pseudouridine55 synthase
VKVDGRRSYARVRAGEEVRLEPRPVRVTAFVVDDVRSALGRDGRAVLDVDVRVTCSAGTYVRALARDLGADLGVGGHLTALRRTRSGTFDVAAARSLDDLAALAEGDGLAAAVTGLAEAVATAFPVWRVPEADADRVAHGVRLPWPAGLGDGGPVGVLGPDGAVLALARREGDVAAYLAVLA